MVDRDQNGTPQDGHVSPQINETTTVQSADTSDRRLTTSCPETAPAIPRAKVSQDGNKSEPAADPQEKPEYNAEAIMKAFGTNNMDFVRGIASQVILTCERDGTVDKISEDFMLSVIIQMKPTDQVEAIHACQMALVHTQVMKYGRELANAKTIAHADIAANILNKLVRMFGDQTERLKRHRPGGEQQKVTVQNVSVSDGGQAIVGNVTQNAVSDSKAKPAMTPPALTDARGVPMEMIKPNEQPVAAAHKKGSRQ